jgi:hypothetical protein
MAKRDLPTPETLRQLLRYEPDTGKLFWLPRDQTFFTKGNSKRSPQGRANLWNSANAGKEALVTDSKGYRQGTLFGKTVKAHRIAFAIFHGRVPSGHIDHINANRSDNRIENLRECSNAENCRNTSSMKGGTSNFLGVCWYARNKRWHSQITVNRRRLHLGFFRDEEEAAKAYDAAAEAHFGEFARLNFPKTTQSNA